MPKNAKAVGSSKRYPALTKFEMTRVNGSTETRWRAVLLIPRDEVGKMPMLKKDFWGLTEREAADKRDAARLDMLRPRTPVAATPEPDGDRRTIKQFLHEDYFPVLRAEQGGTIHVLTKIARFTNYLFAPTGAHAKYADLAKCKLATRRVCDVTAADFAEYFVQMKLLEVGPSVLLKIRMDWSHLLQAMCLPLTLLQGKFTQIKAPDYTTKITFDGSDVYRALCDPRSDPQARVAFAFVFDLLRRPAGIWRLNWSDIDMTAGTVFCRKEKKERNDRTLPIPGYVMDALRYLHKRRGNDPWVFRSPEGARMYPHAWARLYPQYCREMGLKDENGGLPTFYKLKHAGNGWQDANGVGLLIRIHKAGHADGKMLTSTKVYNASRDSEVASAQADFEARLRATTTSVRTP